MNKPYLKIISRLTLLSASLLIFSCKTDLNEKELLSKVSENLCKIKSATYISTGTASAPGDTLKFTEPIRQYIKISINPEDTLVGSKYLIYNQEDTTEITDFYDGKAKGTINWDEHSVKVDSFQNYPYPFRLVYYPFYTKINEIIKYSLTTKDSIRTDFKDYGDSIFFSLKIINKHVYFHIKPIVIKNESIPENEISQFDIWIRKSDKLPYRMRSKWHHTTFYEECINAKFNTTNDVNLLSTIYFPENFKIIQFKRGTKEYKNELEGKVAPEWTLKDIENNVISLKDLKSKVILIQFTGVGCGPCHSSISFLKQLVEDYKDKDFKFVCIETWSKNIEGLKRYQEMNCLNFMFLKTVENVTKEYGVTSVPTFFIIDKKRVIRKVINGYNKDETDKEILKNIHELI
jgi:thiol-disulfide isomerase/thioredoxin